MVIGSNPSKRVFPSKNIYGTAFLENMSGSIKKARNCGPFWDNIDILLSDRGVRITWILIFVERFGLFINDASN